VKAALFGITGAAEQYVFFGVLVWGLSWVCGVWLRDVSAGAGDDVISTLAEAEGVPGIE
jgi:hypothetical protein